MIADRAIDAAIVVAILLAGGLVGKIALDANATARGKLEVQTDTGVAHSLEAQGSTHLLERTEATLRQANATQARTDAAIADLRATPAARAALDPAVADRLRADDQRLCASAPALCGPAAADPPF